MARYSITILENRLQELEEKKTQIANYSYLDSEIKSHLEKIKRRIGEIKTDILYIHECNQIN